MGRKIIVRRPVRVTVHRRITWRTRVTVRVRRIRR